MENRFETPDPIELVVALGAGSLQIEASSSAHTHVEVSGPRAEEFTVEQSGRRVSVIAPRQRGGFVHGNDAHQVRVLLPTGSDLSTKTGSADTRAAGTYGTVRAKTGSGDIDLDAADGPVELVSGSGALRCGEASAGMRVKTGSGDVELGSVRETLAISTGSGDVSVGSAPPATVVKTGSGSADVRRANGDLELMTGSGAIRVGHAEHGRIRARTGSGDLRIGVPGGIPVWTDAHTGTGRIASDLPPVGKPAEGQDHLELRLNTGSGDILLSRV